MATVKAKTAARGYGASHQAERERRLAAYRPGDLCAHCGRPITWWPLKVARQLIDLPHTTDRSGYLPGLAHRSCNRGEANRRRNVVRTWQQSRLW